MVMSLSRELCKGELEGSHGDRADVPDGHGHRGLHHYEGLNSPHSSWVAQLRYLALIHAGQFQRRRLQLDVDPLGVCLAGKVRDHVAA